jgi:hypothetical protein
MDLKDYAARLTNETERARALQALDDAENLPISVEVIDGIEARYGDGVGLVDVDQCLSDEMSKRAGSTEFEALMRAAALLHIRMAFKKLEVDGRFCYVRLDKVQ